MKFIQAVSHQADFGRSASTSGTVVTDSVAERNRKLKQVTAASQHLASLRDSHKVVMTTMTHITELLGIRHAVFWSWSDEQKNFYCRSASTQRLYAALRDHKITRGHAIVGWVAEQNRCGLFTGNDHEYLDYRERLEKFHFVSVLAIPLRINGKVDSVLEIFSPLQRISPENIELANTLANSAAIALGNAELVETLRQKTNELEARNQALDAFAHTVAHDLRTPLNWVNGYIELLIKDWDILNPDERIEYARATHHGSQVMSNIIDDLLLLASLHDADVVYTSVNMVSVLERARLRLEPMLRQYNAKLTVECEYPNALGYGPWIEGVWVNYISNAIKYGGSPPEIKVGCEELDGFVMFWVQDNGAGLTDEQQKQLFIPFTGTGKKHGKGYGLGLSIVRRIVEKLGGQVSVESSAEHGSRFMFTLPKA